MSFASGISIKNIKRKPFRATLLFALVLLIAFSLFSGAFVIISLRNGLECYQSRLGADIVVTPSSARGHGSVDDILLSGITGNYYMSGKDFEKVASTEGIASITRQFFLTSAKASCCSARVQIIGFDPKTDFSIQPWISESYTNEIEDGDVVVGSEINGYDSGLITFYGQEYRIAARLEKTGTGLDNAIYTNMTTVRQMAKNAANLLETSPFQDVDIETATSAVLIKVAEGYSIEDVADDINSPKIIIADEPTGDLDDDTTRLVLSLLRKKADEGASVLIVTHEHDALQYADQIFRMEKGVLSKEG